MNKTLVIVIVILIVVLFFLHRNNQENFWNQQISKNYRINKCNNELNTLVKVNNYTDSLCSIDDEGPNHVVNNNRLNCREFVSKKIFLDQDKQTWCKGVTKPDISKLNTPTSTVAPTPTPELNVNDVNASNSNDYLFGKTQPIEQEFPVEIFTDYDNK